MSETYTVVIPHRGEKEELDRTIENIAETQGNCVAIVVEEDRDGNGTAPTRHAGVMKSKTETVITIDAHMRFREEALDRMADFLAEDRKRIGCMSCFSNPELSFDGGAYWGADLHEFGAEYAFEPKWAQRQGAGEIACLMGACYGFSRWFYESFGAPWRIGIGWGCDETLLSIPARLCGGSIHVLPEECAHLMKRAGDVAYRQSREEINAIWYTRNALIEYINPPGISRFRSFMRKKATTLRFQAPVAEARKMLEKAQTVDYAEYRAKWLIVPEAKNETPPPEPEKAVPPPPKPPEKKRESLHSVTDYGIHCPHCGAVSDRHRITTTYPNGRRRRICIECGRPFVSSFVV